MEAAAVVVVTVLLQIREVGWFVRAVCLSPWTLRDGGGGGW